jgi:hypothetical protein
MARGGCGRYRQHKGCSRINGPDCLRRPKAEAAESHARKEALTRRDISPWLLSRSRIGPPIREEGLGNLAAGPVLPWRSSGPIPRATLDTDAETGRSRKIDAEFHRGVADQTRIEWVSLYQDTSTGEKVRSRKTVSTGFKLYSRRSAGKTSSERLRGIRRGKTPGKWRTTTKCADVQRSRSFGEVRNHSAPLVAREAKGIRLSRMADL